MVSILPGNIEVPLFSSILHLSSQILKFLYRISCLLASAVYSSSSNSLHVNSRDFKMEGSSGEDFQIFLLKLKHQEISYDPLCFFWLSIQLKCLTSYYGMLPLPISLIVKFKVNIWGTLEFPPSILSSFFWSNQGQ